MADLFTYSPLDYPHASAGSKRVGPSEEAAKAVTPKLEEAWALMLAKYRERGPMTADQASAACGWSIFYGRPRNSELVKQGKLIETGERRPSANHRSAAVWAPQSARVG